MKKYSIYIIVLLVSFFSFLYPKKIKLKAEPWAKEVLEDAEYGKGPLALLLNHPSQWQPIARSIAAGPDPRCTNLPTNANAVMKENCTKTGVERSKWDLAENDNDNNGYTNQTSYLPGQIVYFQIKAQAQSRLEIYRLGYYNGSGAALVTTIDPIPLTRTTQPACNIDNIFFMVDCGNWKTSTQWQIGNTAVSGVYFAKLYTVDAQGTATARSIIPFVVKSNETTGSDILFQVSDVNWQVYNEYGGYNLYYRLESDGSHTNSARGKKVTFNRPYASKGNLYQAWHRNFFDAHMPLLYWLESQGYRINYISEIDTETNPALIKSAKIFMNVGHDEYWTSTMRENVTRALREAGTSLAFLTGNTMFERVIIDSVTHRTIYGAKEIFGSQPSDYGPHQEYSPSEKNPIHTTVPRDLRFEKKNQPIDTQFNYDLVPENELTGLAYTTYNPGSPAPFTIPSDFKKLRQWRNVTPVTSLPSGGIYKGFNQYSLAYELDERQDNGFEPPGMFSISSTHISSTHVEPDFPTLSIEQSVLASSAERSLKTTMDHQLALFRHPQSRGWVFSAGTIQFPVALSNVHHNSSDTTNNTPEFAMQQMFINILADMGVKPGFSLQSPFSLSGTTDNTAPTVSISSLNNNMTVPYNKTHTISGIANDVGGIVAGVEVSVDGGSSFHQTTWHRANLKMPLDSSLSWSYEWVPAYVGKVVLQVRAVDDSGNISNVSSIAVNVKTSDSIAKDQIPVVYYDRTPFTAEGGIELGVRFSSDLPGIVKGVRFYKPFSGNAEYDISFWDSNGRNAKTRHILTSELGWVEALFDSPLTISPKSFYTVSYHSKNGYAYQMGANQKGVITYNPPLRIGSNLFKVGPFDLQNLTAAWPTKLMAFDSKGMGVGCLVEPIFETAQPSVNSHHEILTSFLNNAPPTADSAYRVDRVTAGGIRFQALTDGQILGIKLYKAANNNGLHIATLYRNQRATETGDYKVLTRTTDDADANGYAPADSLFERMADTRFVNESLSGWQTTYFSRPVIIQKGMEYVAAVHSTSGFTVQNGIDSFLTAWPLSNPVKFLAAVEYSSEGGDDRSHEMPGLPEGVSFDQNTKNLGYHYMVDIVFKPTAAPTSKMWTDMTYPSVGLADTVTGPYQYALRGESPSTKAVNGRTGNFQLGNKFISETSGYITGIRVYKSAPNALPSVANLWWQGNKSTPIRQASFTDIGTATGWVTAQFSKPFRMPRAELFIASYVPNGSYAVTYNYFAHGLGTYNPPLRMPGLVLDGARIAEGMRLIGLNPPQNPPAPPLIPSRVSEMGPNGVTGAANVYPEEQVVGAPGIYNNYWVEPVFSSNPGPTLKPVAIECSGKQEGEVCSTGRCSARGECLSENDWCLPALVTSNDCIEGKIKLLTISSSLSKPMCQHVFAPKAQPCIKLEDGKMGACGDSGQCL